MSMELRSRKKTPATAPLAVTMRSQQTQTTFPIDEETQTSEDNLNRVEEPTCCDDCLLCCKRNLFICLSILCKPFAE